MEDAEDDGVKAATDFILVINIYSVLYRGRVDVCHFVLASKISNVLYSITTNGSFANDVR
jgi:hypothetical protein